MKDFQQKRKGSKSEQSKPFHFTKIICVGVSLLCIYGLLKFDKSSQDMEPWEEGKNVPLPVGFVA